MVNFNYLSLDWFSLIRDFWLNHQRYVPPMPSMNQGQYSTTSLAEPSGEFDLEFVGQCLYALEWRYGRLWGGHEWWIWWIWPTILHVQTVSAEENKFDPTTNSMNGFFLFSDSPQAKTKLTETQILQNSIPQQFGTKHCANVIRHPAASVRSARSPGVYASEIDPSTDTMWALTPLAWWPSAQRAQPEGQITLRVMVSSVFYWKYIYWIFEICTNLVIWI